TYEPTHIRKTSMTLAKRSEASALYEKSLDPELIEVATRRAIDLLVEHTNGKPENEILDIYPSSYKGKKVSTNKNFIENRLGIKLTTQEITNTLKPLGFDVLWKRDNLEVTVPSYRAKDINIPEDVTEEVARIYGYHNIPNKIMSGELPQQTINTPFRFESKIRNLLMGMGGIEIYTLSLVSVKESRGLKLKNPLGKETEYLRTHLHSSHEMAIKQNSHIKEPFFIYELANVYLLRKNDLPEEKMKLAISFSNYDYRKAKGVIEALLEQLNIESVLEEPVVDMGVFPNPGWVIRSKNTYLGELKSRLPVPEIYSEFDLDNLRSVSNEVRGFDPIPKYPPQVEDITFNLLGETKIGSMITEILSVTFVKEVQLKDIYQDAYTFSIKFQSDHKTLTNQEVEKIREKLILLVNKKFGATVKN
ncbi:MAG: hypothetical protein AAB546_02185, partial [Patescibacteria group bacterium]